MGQVLCAGSRSPYFPDSAGIAQVMRALLRGARKNSSPCKRNLNTRGDGACCAAAPPRSTIGREAASSSVAPHIIAMAEALGFEVVAEGIEHEEQARFLRERGAQFGQGWLFSRALPADGLQAYLSSPARP
ncbi:EAL domain-containing protein [Cupriavidus sp. GA3-3]|uniref:EAL domain-containing protein n=1 Tax=Cupriavidus TaxID=106589 RepID=UPI0009DBEE41